MIKKVRLEACSLCQLDCQDCFMRRYPRAVKAIGLGYLSFTNFKKFLRLNPEITNIELSNAGEIFLNPDLLKIMNYAHAHGVVLSAYGGVNLNDASDEILEALVTTNFNKLVVSLDGASQPSYSCYRRGGSFDKVVANIQKINHYKAKHNSKNPRLLWKYIIFRSTEKLEEIKKAKKLARQLKMKLFFYKDYMGYVPRQLRMIKKETGLVYSRQKFKEETAFDRSDYFPCFALWHEPQINWDGRFLGCCANHKGSFSRDNLFEISLREYMNKPLITKTKRILQGEKLLVLSQCYRCYFYWQMFEHQNFIRDEELAAFAKRN